MIFFQIIIIQSVNLDGTWTVFTHTALELNIQPVDSDLRRFVYPTHPPDHQEQHLRNQFRHVRVFLVVKYWLYFRACLHGSGGTQVGEAPRLGGVTHLPI